MKHGAVLRKEVVAEALKKTRRYGLTGFAEVKPKTEKPKYASVVVGISGMNLESCAKSVREALAKLEGVEAVTVDLDKKNALIKLKKNAALSKNDVVAALSKTRYKVTSFEGKPLP